MSKENYSLTVMNYFSEIDKKNKRLASVISTVIGILFAVAITIIFVPLFMQFIFVKHVCIILIAIVSFSTYVLLCMMSSLYYVVLNNISNLNADISFSKLFCSYLINPFSMGLLVIVILVFSFGLYFFLWWGVLWKRKSLII